MSSDKRPAAYRLLAADELGVLKVIEVPAGPKWADAAVVQSWGEADKENGITCVCCSTSNLDPGTAGFVAVGRKGRRVDILDAATGAKQASITAAAPDKPAAGAAAAAKVQIAAVAFIQQTADRPVQLIAATSDGAISICTCSSSNTNSSTATDNSSSSWSVSRSFQAGSSITCMAISSSGTHLLLGGEGVQPSIWDIATGVRLWQAKGGKPHKQTLLVDKAHTTALAFLPSSGSSSDDDGAAAARQDVKVQFVAGSVSAKLQVYDTAAGRRPQLEVAFGDTRITAVAPEHNGIRVWAANGTGHIQVLDLDSRKMVDALKGAGGSVRSLAVHPNGEQLVASVGLDRFLRVHNTDSKAGCCRVYLKQQLTGVCWLPVLQPALPAAEGTDKVHADAEAPLRSKKDKKRQSKQGNGAELEPLPGKKKKK